MGVRIHAVLAAVLAAPTAALAYEPLPTACEVLEAAGASDILGRPLGYNTLTEQRTDTVSMSICHGTGDDEADILVSLMVREVVTGDASQSSEEQRDQMLTEMAEMMGSEEGLSQVDFAEGAMLNGMMSQFTVWARDGNLMLILDPVTDDVELERAKRLAQAILDLAE